MSTGAPRWRHQAVVAVCLAMTVVGLNTTAIGVATRGIAGELDLAPDELSWIVGAYLITAAAFSLVGGRLGDVVGRARTFVGGVALFALGSLVAATAPSTEVLIVARVIQGLGAALVLPSSIELVAAFPPKTGPRSGFRARGVVYSSAFGIGPLVGGLLTDDVTWRAIFWLELVVLVGAGALAVPLLRARSHLPAPPTRDIRGAVTSALLVAVSLGAVARSSVWGWWSREMAVAAAASLLLAALLVRIESRTAHPLLHRRVLTDRLVLGANVATLAASIGMLGLLYFFNLFAQSAAVFDATALAVAIALVPFTASIVVFALAAQRLSARFGYRGPVLVGLGAATIGFFWLSTTGATTSELDLAVPLTLCGIGAGIANAGLTTPAVLALPRTRLDEAAGLFSLTRYVGSALAIAIGTSTYLAVAVRLPLPDELPGSIETKDIATGRSTFQQALETLGDDLRGPFEAATRAQTAEAFASTMRLAGVVLAVLTVISIVLLRPAADGDDPSGADVPAARPA